MRHDGPVVIAVDGSPHSARTIEWGLTEAGLRGAEVVLAHAYQEPPEYAGWGWYPVLPDPPLGTLARQYAADALDRASARRPDLRITTRVLHGPEVPLLRALAQDAQLLVVGAGARPGRTGRVAAHLAAHAPCPVAVVRGVVGTSRVVVGVDGSASSLEAAEVAARAAVARDVPLVVVHARPTVTAPYGGAPALPPLASADEDDPTHRAAAQAAAGLRERHPRLDVRLELADDDPAHALVERAPAGSLLVVGSRGLGAFRGMLLGAVSNEVVRSATCTVLVVHDGEAA